MSIIHANAENFESEVLKNKKTVILDFYADWCGPCRMLAPVLEKIDAEREDISIAKVNVDNEPSLAEAFGVTSIPAIFVLKNGEVVNQAVGVRPKAQILQLL